MIYRGDSYKAVGYHRRPTHSTEDGTLAIKFPGNTYTEAACPRTAMGRDTELSGHLVDSQRQRQQDSGVRLCSRRTQRVWVSFAG